MFLLFYDVTQHLGQIHQFPSLLFRSRRFWRHHEGPFGSGWEGWCLKKVFDVFGFHDFCWGGKNTAQKSLTKKTNLFDVGACLTAEKDGNRIILISQGPLWAIIIDSYSVLAGPQVLYTIRCFFPRVMPVFILTIFHQLARMSGMSIVEVIVVLKLRLDLSTLTIHLVAWGYLTV